MPEDSWRVQCGLTPLYIKIRRSVRSERQRGPSNTFRFTTSVRQRGHRTQIPLDSVRGDEDREPFRLADPERSAGDERAGASPHGGPQGRVKEL